MPNEILEALNTSISLNTNYHTVLNKIEHNNQMEYIKKIYIDYYENQDVEKVLSYTRNDKFRRRKRLWLEKPLEGLERYKKDNTLLKGHYRILVDFYTRFKEDEMKYGQDKFFDLYAAPNSEEKMNTFIEKLETWHKSKTSFLSDYPYFDDLSKSQQKAAIEIDMVLIIGTLFKEYLSKLTKELTSSSSEDSLDAEDGAHFVERIISPIINNPFLGLSNKAVAKVGKGTTLTEELGNNKNSTFLPLQKKRAYELSSELEMFVDSSLIDGNKSGVLTPNVSDYRVFVNLINKRDADFHASRTIRVYLSELIEDTYENIGKNIYKALSDRLMRLGLFRIVVNGVDGQFEIKSLFSDLKVFQNPNDQDRWTVEATVSNSVRDAIIEGQTFNIYNKKVKELESDFSYLLVFILQKHRLINSQLDSTNTKRQDTFEMKWKHFNSSIRFNKPTKKENIAEIEKALGEIKNKGFLVKSFVKLNDSFIITFYPLNEREIDDMNKMKIQYKDGILQIE